MNAQKKHIFISHASEDKRRIRPILERLLEAGFTVWVDEPRNFVPRFKHPRLQGIRSFEAWDKSIAGSLDSAGSILGIWSKSWLEGDRDELKAEVRRAKRDQKLVFVSIDRPGDDELSLGLDLRHAKPLAEELADFLAGRTTALDIDDVIADIEAVISRGQPLAPPAASQTLTR